MIVLAHAGHWLLYAIPVAIVLGAVVLASVGERRARREAEGRSTGEDAGGRPRPR